MCLVYIQDDKKSPFTLKGSAFAIDLIGFPAPSTTGILQPFISLVMSPAVFFTKFIQIGVSELNRYKWWTLGIPREQKLYWFLPKQLPHDLPPQTVVPRSLWSPMSPPPSWWIGTWSFIPHMFQSPHPGQGCHGNVGIDPFNVCQRKVKT